MAHPVKSTTIREHPHICVSTDYMAEEEGDDEARQYSRYLTIREEGEDVYKETPFETMLFINTNSPKAFGDLPTGQWGVYQRSVTEEEALIVHQRFVREAKDPMLQHLAKYDLLELHSEAQQVGYRIRVADGWMFHLEYEAGLPEFQRSGNAVRVFKDDERGRQDARAFLATVQAAIDEHKYHQAIRAKLQELLVPYLAELYRTPEDKPLSVNYVRGVIASEAFGYMWEERHPQCTTWEQERELYTRLAEVEMRFAGFRFARE